MNKIVDIKPEPNYAAIKDKQKGIWSSGDYARVGTTLQIVGEKLADAMDVHADQKILDVAAGNGNFTLAAARRWADITSTDYVHSLLERGKQRAIADGFDLTFELADAEDLPFADGIFDAAASTFGVMFAPNQKQAASEMKRVVRKGGKIGLATWTPNGFVGVMSGIIRDYVPMPAGLDSPMLWGTDAHLETLFGQQVEEIEIVRKHFNFRYRSADHWLEVFRRYYGPLHMAFETLDDLQQQALAQDLINMIEQMNQSEDESMRVPGEYLEVVITR